jgi:osmotically-inducible protein OsmY
VDITAAFIDHGAVIAQLTAVQFSGIVVLRGKTSDPARSEEAGRIARTLGHGRVANLIVIVDDEVVDAAISADGHRRLELERDLEGCRFRVESKRGVIHLTGRVLRHTQAELAAAIVGKIPGVREVQTTLTTIPE